MKYVVVMEGITGEFRTECGSVEEAERLSASQAGLGYESRIEVVEETKKRVHLQHWGEQGAVEVQDLGPGMVTVWNGGCRREIAGIVSSPSGKTHRIVYADGTVDSRRMRTGRLVAVEL